MRTLHSRGYIVNRPSRRRIAWVSAIACAVAVPVSVHAQATLAEAQTPARYARSIEFARTLIAALMEESGTPGMSVAVGINGEIVWAEGFGYADVEQKVPVWEETKFRIGSVSKPLTAAAVGLLVERGKLDLDAPIQRYVPTFPTKRWPITTRQVAGHLSGIRHYRGDETLSAVRYPTVADGLAIFQDDTLLFEPGDRFSYSSYGWNLISAVVERASGQEFLSYMQQNVFDRIGMRHTVADHTDSIVPHRTRFYERNEDGRVLNAPYVDNSYKWAGGGFLSTPSDLVRFGFAHFGEDLLQSETIAQLWTPQHTNAGESTGYGIGWTVAVEGGVVVRAGHGGGSVGGTAGFETRPPQRAAIAILGNLSQAPTGGLVVALITEAFLDPETLASTGTGPDITGEFECVVMAGAQEAVRGTMTLRGVPAQYWGYVAWSNHTVDRVIYSASSAGKTRLVTIDDGANLLELEFAGSDDAGLQGTWRSGGRGTVTCSRR
jgi:serine beta-lactamase-like protein LACTB